MRTIIICILLNFSHDWHDILSRSKIAALHLKDVHQVVLSKINSENSMKMVKLRWFLTTKSFGFMNLRRLAFRLWLNRRKTKLWVGNHHNTTFGIKNDNSQLTLVKTPSLWFYLSRMVIYILSFWAFLILTNNSWWQFKSFFARLTPVLLSPRACPKATTISLGQLSASTVMVLACARCAGVAVAKAWCNWNSKR